MGAYSPAPVVTDQVHQRVMEQVIYPTVKGMDKEGNRYQGFLYAGLMIDKAGNPKVIEFNCRFGDPETQPIMMRLQSDLVALCLAGAKGELAGKDSLWDERPALGVVIAAGGYPGDYRNGDIISGLPTSEAADSKVFHAGTRMKEGEVVTAGTVYYVLPHWVMILKKPKQKHTRQLKTFTGMIASIVAILATALSPVLSNRTNNRNKRP